VGTVSRISQIPRPGSVPYKEHIVGIQLVDVRGENSAASPERDVLMYTWSMRDQKLTAAAHLRPGDRIAVTLQPWDEVADANEKFQRSELPDPALLTEPFHWGEGVELRPAKRGEESGR
jgi:alginate O-acetyltransferase complex protein AlgJ